MKFSGYQMPIHVKFYPCLVLGKKGSFLLANCKHALDGEHLGC